MWECLAEAYVQRGSLKTALKAYQYTADLYDKTEQIDKLIKISYRSIVSWNIRSWISNRNI